MAKNLTQRVVIFVCLSFVFGKRKCTVPNKSGFYKEGDMNGCVKIRKCEFNDTHILVKWTQPESSFMEKYEVTFLNKDIDVPCSRTFRHRHKKKGNTYQILINHAWTSKHTVVDVSVTYRTHIRANTTKDHTNTKRTTFITKEKDRSTSQENFLSVTYPVISTSIKMTYSGNTPTVSLNTNITGDTERLYTVTRNSIGREETRNDHLSDTYFKPTMATVIGLLCGVLTVMIFITVIAIKQRLRRSHIETIGKSVTNSKVPKSSEEDDIYNHLSRGNASQECVTDKKANNISNGEDIYNHSSCDKHMNGSHRHPEGADNIKGDNYRCNNRGYESHEQPDGKEREVDKGHGNCKEDIYNHLSRGETGDSSINKLISEDIYNHADPYLQNADLTVHNDMCIFKP